MRVPTHLTSEVLTKHQFFDVTLKQFDMQHSGRKTFFSQNTRCAWSHHLCMPQLINWRSSISRALESAPNSPDLLSFDTNSFIPTVATPTLDSSYRQLINRALTGFGIWNLDFSIICWAKFTTRLKCWAVIKTLKIHHKLNTFFFNLRLWLQNIRFIKILEFAPKIKTLQALQPVFKLKIF